MPRIFGLDVSHHQGTLSWPSIASGGVEFCFIKATEGTSFVDDKFERNWRGAQDAGLFRGAYHFGRVGSDPATQAVHFRSVVGALGFRDLPPVLDIEEANGHSPDRVISWTRDFLAKARELFDRQPIVYTGHFWRDYMGNPADPFFGQHPLWLAGYVAEPKLKVPAAWPKWTFWQYTDGKHNNPRSIPGVPACDQNFFEGTTAELDALCSPASTPLPPLPPVPNDNAWPGTYLAWRQSPALSGDAVRRFQERMAKLGYAIVADGAYGPQSKRVCQAFQKENGLSADGIVGPKTWQLAFGP